MQNKVINTQNDTDQFVIPNSGWSTYSDTFNNNNNNNSNNNSEFDNNVSRKNYSN